MNAVTQEEKFRGCLAGVAIGDALGMPGETLTRGQIHALTMGLGINGFIRPIQNHITETMNLEIGSSTDDWAFTELVAISIINSNGYDHESQVWTSTTALKSKIPGMGKTTLEALKELDLYYTTNGNQGRSPWMPVAKKSGFGAGNGVAMKVAPLGLLKSITNKPGDIANNRPLGILNMFSKITHWDDQAMIAAYVIMETINQVTRKSIIDQSDSMKLIDDLLKNVLILEHYYRRTEMKTKVSDQLKILKDNVDNPEKIYQLIGPGFLATQSCLMALDGFTRYPTDFRKAVLTAVNDGGDADTTASMVGAMCGANVGINGIPKELLNFGHGQFLEAAEVGKSLYQSLTLLRHMLGR